MNLGLLDICLFPKASRMALVPTQPRIKCVIGTLFFSVKRLQLNLIT